MKKHRGLKIVLIVVAALTVLGLGALGVRALMFHRGYMPGMIDRMPYGTYEDMHPDGDDRFGGMPCDRGYSRGMMPYSFHRRGGFGTPWAGLLVIGLLGLGALHFAHMHHFRRVMIHRYMHSGHMDTGCCHEHGHADEDPEVTPTE